MTAATYPTTPTAPYTHRLATPEDADVIAPLWIAFAQERANTDPTMAIKPGYDFKKYVAHQLTKPLSYGWVLEHSDNINQKTIVGFLFIYVYDEAPPSNLPQDLLQQHELENPFLPRRVGSVLGMYIQAEHRQPENIKHLAEAAINQAEQLKVTDIDLLISAEQTGLQKLLKRLEFTPTAVQYTRHYTIPIDATLPDLHPPHPDLGLPEAPTPNAIALRDPQTNELVRNPFGELVFLKPLEDASGELLTTSNDLPIYPIPLRDPHKNDWVFNQAGELVICPVLQDENGQIVEHQGIPQFHQPTYKLVEGKVQLKQDSQGNYIFCEVERDPDGKILRTPDGMPIFKPPF